jgi:DNA-binding phage protein
MSKTAILTRRLIRVMTFQQEQAVHRYLTETARELNIDPAELLAEYQRVIQRCQAAGAVTREAQIVIVADELGISVEELEGDLARIEAGRT